MGDKTPSSSEIIDNVRNLTISRRGGVRTRGGRLPSINVRELTQLTSSKKKVVAPTIPQRRRIIKTESESPGQTVVKSEKPENSQGGGKGRQQRVYIQTGGLYLADGPVARIKRDPVYDGGYSSSRVSRKAAGACKNIDADTIKDLMESYVAGEEYENINEGKPPVRLPFQKNKMSCKIKVEPDDEIKTEIKKEIIEDFETGIKKEIKTEKDEELASVKNEDLVSVKDSVVFKEEIESKKLLSEKLLDAKEDRGLILLQLPLLSASLNAEASEKGKGDKDKKTAKENEPKPSSKFIDNFEEGFIGKLKIMKSGRMKLTLGPVEFELTEGCRPETYQEAVSIQMRDNGGDVTVLGKIEDKLILSPMINKLLKVKETLGFGEE